MLNREELLAALQLKTEIVELDGGPVRISEISATDYLALWERHRRDDDTIDMATFTPELIAACLVDDEGQRLFTDADATLLARSAKAPFFQLADACRRINGLGGDEVKN